jgi:hypothetical protein
MPDYDQDERDGQQARLPPGWRVTYAPGFGYFIQAAGARDRQGEFGTAAAVVDAFLASRHNAPRLRTDEIWVEAGGVKYLDPLKIDDLPFATADGDCPNCLAARPEAYDDPNFVGMTEPDADGGWVEAWGCECGWRYRHDNRGDA